MLEYSKRQIEFEFQLTARTMGGKVSDLEAFDS